MENNLDCDSMQDKQNNLNVEEKRTEERVYTTDNKLIVNPLGPADPILGQPIYRHHSLISANRIM